MPWSSSRFSQSTNKRSSLVSLLFLILTNKWRHMLSLPLTTNKWSRSRRLQRSLNLMCKKTRMKMCSTESPTTSQKISKSTWSSSSPTCTIRGPRWLRTTHATKASTQTSSSNANASKVWPWTSTRANNILIKTYLVLLLTSWKRSQSSLMNSRLSTERKCLRHRRTRKCLLNRDLSRLESPMCSRRTNREHLITWLRRHRIWRMVK